MPDSAHHLTIPNHVGVLAGEAGLFLVTCNIAMAKAVPHATSVGVAWFQAVVSKLHNRHFMYVADTFDGDSGGAIVIARTGEVIGLHQELVNRRKDLIEQHVSIGKRLTAAEASIKSLVENSTKGCVGLRMDTPELLAQRP